MELFLAWVFFALLVALVGKDRNIGFGVTFLLSLILSPLVGLIIALFSDHKRSSTADNITRVTTDGYRQQTAPYIPGIPINPHIKNEPVDQPKKTPTDVSVAKQIAEWKSLLDSGAITQEEYDKQKTKLLQ